MAHLPHFGRHFNHFFISRTGKYVDIDSAAWRNRGMNKLIPAVLALYISAPAVLSASPLFSYPGARTFDADGTADAVQTGSRLTTVGLPEIDGRDSFACIRDRSILRRAEVRRSLYLYLAEGRDYALRGIQKADMLKDDVDSVLEKYNVPREVAALPLLESGYEPFAVSRMKAVGVWQIIAPTAAALGLTVNRWTDERRDVKKSTAAALQHLSHLYTLYNHWDFALAAYNGGSPRVTQAIVRKKTRDYWTLVELSAFRKETNDYVPQFAALAYIYFNRDVFGIPASNAARTPTEQITLEHPVRIDALARIAGTSVETVMRLNPEMTGPITPPDRGSCAVTLPAGCADRIMGKEDELYRYKVSYVSRYRVRKGDSLGKIAKLYGADVASIIYLNGIEKPYRLKIGRELWVPKG